MQKRVSTTLTIVTCLLAITVPILAALYLSHRQSMDEEVARAHAMSGEVLRRSEEMGRQALSAYDRLHQARLADPCSEASLALMRDIALASNYLQAVGHVRGNRLVCSSFGDHGQGIPLGTAAYTSTLDARVRPSVDLGLGADRRFLVFEKDGYAVVIHPDTLLDVYLDVPAVSIGTFGLSSGQQMGTRGAFDPRWTKKLGDARQKSFFDGRHLVAIQRSETFDFASYVAVPVTYLRSRLRVFANILVPLGVVLGLGMSLAIYLLARQQGSMPATLRSALKQREFTLHYQPIVDLQTRRMVGVEALMRWPRPGGLEVRPSLFIPAAEDCRLIQQFTSYVLAQVALDAPAFIARHPDCYISINLSSPDLHDTATVEALRRLVATSGVTPGNLMVEVTEHSFLDAQRASRTVAEIRALGIRVAIDDFGTGFSSLSHLTQLKTDYLKIDKIFVDTVGTNAATSEVALHIIRVAKSLHMALIGEGIESEAQATFLQRNGVEYGQGWLFSKAMPMAKLLADPQLA